MFAGYAFAQQPFATSVGFYYTASTADTATALDSVSALVAFLSTAPETATAQDSAATRADLFSFAADTAIGQDAALGNTVFLNFTSDTATAADQVSALPTYPAQTADSATAADEASALPTYFTLAQENATGQDAAASLSVFTALAEETVAGSEEAVSGKNAGALVLVSASIAYTASARIDLLASVQEDATTLDAASTRADFRSLAADTVIARDFPNANVSVLAFVSEGALAFDTTLFRFLWNPIDDDQSPGWTDVLPSITISEVGTFAGGTFGGFPYAGTYNQTFSPYVTAWVEINNDQTPVWTPIDAPS